VDEWPRGVTLSTLLCGSPPFYDEDNAALFAQIKAARFDFPSPYWDDVSESAKDLVRKLLVVDPAARLAAADVARHPWVAGGAVATPLNIASELRKFNARRRFREGVRKVQALQKFAKLGKFGAAVSEALKNRSAVAGDDSSPAAAAAAGGGGGGSGSPAGGAGGPASAAAAAAAPAKK